MHQAPKPSIMQYNDTVMLQSDPRTAGLLPTKAEQLFEFSSEPGIRTGITRGANPRSARPD
jgi:hypothetical protein